MEIPHRTCTPSQCFRSSQPHPFGRHDAQGRPPCQPISVQAPNPSPLPHSFALSLPLPLPPSLSLICAVQHRLTGSQAHRLLILISKVHVVNNRPRLTFVQAAGITYMGLLASPLDLPRLLSPLRYSGADGSDGSDGSATLSSARSHLLVQSIFSSIFHLPSSILIHPVPWYSHHLLFDSYSGLYPATSALDHAQSNRSLLCFARTPPLAFSLPAFLTLHPPSLPLPLCVVPAILMLSGR